MPELPQRGEEREFFELSVDQANQRRSDLLAQLGVLGVGMHVLGRKSNINIIHELIDLAGDGAAFLGGLTKKKGPLTIQPEVANRLRLAMDVSEDGGSAVLKRRWGGARLDEVESIRDIMDSLGAMTDPKNFKDKKALSARFKEFFGRMPRVGSGSQGTAFFHHDLDRLTFGDILDNQSTWIERVMGSKTGSMSTRGPGGKKESLELASIKKAIEYNWISRDTVIDPKLFTSKGTRRSKRVIDTRLLQPKYAINQLSKIVDIADIMKNTAGSLFGTSRNIAMVGPKTLGGANRIVIGTNAFEATDTGNLKKVASNVRLGRIGDMLYVPTKLRQAQQRGTLKQLYTGPETDSLWSKLQHKIGIGPEFQARPGGMLQTALRGLRHMRAVARGDAVIVGQAYKKEKFNIFDLLKVPEANLGEVTDMVKGKWHDLAGKDVGKKLSFIEKIKAFAGYNPDVSIIKKGSLGKLNLNKDDFYLPFRRSGLGSLEVPMGKSKTATGVTMTGAPSYTRRPEYYLSDISKIDRLYDFGNYLSIRLNTLASNSMLGIGFRPSGNLLGNMARLAAIPATYMVGTELLKYGAYKTGIDERLADVYAGGRVLQQTAREFTGVAGFSNFFEQLFPGMNFGLIGTGVAGLAGIGVLGKTGSFLKAGAAAGGIYAAAGGPDVGQAAQELREEYSGERKTPVRKAAWWALGYQPFTGGEISHYAPSWYARLKQQPYKVNVYGSESGYWEHGSMLPTFENWFHAKTLLDPYATERNNYYRRPYPVTGGLGEGIPIFGPAIADTLGAVVKPRRTMHSSEMTGGMVATANITNRGVPEDAAARLGLPELPISLVETGRPDVLSDRMGKYANVALEPTGIWKFALGYFGVKFDDKYKVADSGVAESQTRAYYQMGLGGVGGETEFIRRFMLSEYGRPSKLNEMINPIPNQMPRWMPGSLSEYDKDRTYFRDFTRGDPYVKLPGGEHRLPGPGYESVNPLHSGQSGVYDAVDRTLILSDVAPFSQSYFAAKREAQKMQLTDEWKKRLVHAEENRLKKLDRYGFQYGSAGSQSNVAAANQYGSAGSQSNVAAANWNPVLKGVRNTYRSLNEGVLSEIPLLGSKAFPKQDPLGHYLKFQVEGETFADWNDAYRTVVRPAVYNVANEDPVTGAILGGALAGAASGSLPFTSIAKFLNPIQAIANPLSGKSMVYAGTIIGGGLSSARMALTGNISGGINFPHIQKERRVSEYFDKLSYAKYDALAAKAEAMGDSSLAKAMQLKKQSTKTYGIEVLRETGSTEAYQKTLESGERAYFDAFLAAPVGKRASIMKVVPEHMQEALAAAYGQRQNKQPMGEELSQYFSKYGMPNSDWVGWRPDIPEDAIRIRSIQGGINNVADSIHRFNYFPSQEREVRTRFPFVEPAYQEVYPEDGISWIREEIQNASSFSFGVGPATSTASVSFSADRKDDIFAFLNDLRVR